MRYTVLVGALISLAACSVPYTPEEKRNDVFMFCVGRKGTPKDCADAALRFYPDNPPGKVLKKD